MVGRENVLDQGQCAASRAASKSPGTTFGVRPAATVVAVAPRTRARSALPYAGPKGGLRTVPRHRAPAMASPSWAQRADGGNPPEICHRAPGRNCSRRQSSALRAAGGSNRSSCTGWASRRRVAKARAAAGQFAYTDHDPTARATTSQASTSTSTSGKSATLGGLAAPRGRSRPEDAAKRRPSRCSARIIEDPGLHRGQHFAGQVGAASRAQAISAPHARRSGCGQGRCRSASGRGGRRVVVVVQPCRVARNNVSRASTAPSPGGHHRRRRPGTTATAVGRDRRRRGRAQRAGSATTAAHPVRRSRAQRRVDRGSSAVRPGGALCPTRVAPARFHIARASESDGWS